MRRYKLIISIALALLLTCSAVLPAGLFTGRETAGADVFADPADSWLVPGASARQTVTIHNPAGTALTDLPVLVRLNGPDIPNQDGVGFYLGTEQLASELAGWNPGGVCTYWVKVPALPAASDTVVTAYYSSAAMPAAPASKVWGEDYGLVQHFSESAVDREKDSTGNGVLTQTGTLAFRQDELGSAAVFNGTQKIAYTNQVIGANAAQFSASAVVRFKTLAGDKGYYGIVCRDRNGKQEGDTFMLTLSNANINSSVYSNGSGDQRVSVQKAGEAGKAYLLTMTYDGTELKLYIDGALAGSKPAENAALLPSGQSPFTIGAYSDAEVKSGLNGDLYDVFFQTSVISAEEEAFRYANYLGSAVTAGPLELRENQPDAPLSPGNHYLYQAVAADTYCTSKEKGTNYGSEASVMQKRTNVSDGMELDSSTNRRAFVKLDLSELAKIALNRIESVSFDFYQSGDGGKTESVGAKIVDVDPDSWSEREVTWATMPKTYGLPAAARQTLYKKDMAYQSFEITEYVKSKLAEGKKEVSFSLDNEPSNEWGLEWRSRESSENKPRLTVRIKELAPPAFSASVNGSSATLTADLDQNLTDTTEVQFYQAKTIPLTAENTAVYSGVTAETLPDGLTTAGADRKETFGSGKITTAGTGETPYQIYEVTLSGEQQAQSRADFTWTGNTGGHQREVTAYYYSHTSNQWVRADSGSSKGNMSLSLTVPVSDALDPDGKLQLLFWRGMTEPIEGRGGYAPGPGQYDFNIMWSTDSQHYFLDNMKDLQHVKTQFNWIAQHFEEMNSKLFINTGDMVEHYDNADEWLEMSQLYRDTIEKAKIPYAYTVGNHDVNRGNAKKNLFQYYFPVSRLKKNNPYFGDSYDDMTYYYLMEESGAKLMFVGLGIPFTEDAAGWVSEKLSEHPDYTAVLMPHIYIDANGAVDDSKRYGAEVVIPQLRKVITNNSNVKLVLCGHWNGASTNLEEIGGRKVWTLMHDYQDEAEGGRGYFRSLKFDVENNLIYTHTFSASDYGTAMFTKPQPAKEGLYQKHQDEYAISFDFGAAQERILTTEALQLHLPDAAGDPIGTAQTVTGSGRASVTWENLEEAKSYPWFVSLKDGQDQVIVSAVQTLTVPALAIGDIRYHDGTVTVEYTAAGLSDGTPVGVLAFAVGETDGNEVIWNGQGVVHQDIFASQSMKNIVSFPMPDAAGNGVPGRGDARLILIKLGAESATPAAKLFTLPVEPEILSAEASGSGRVTVQLSRPIQDEEILVAAAYDSEGKLLDMKQETQATITAQGENEYVIDLSEIGGAAAVKVMWWNGLQAMRPLCEMKPAELGGSR